MNLELLINSTECGNEINQMEKFYNSMDEELKNFDEKMGIRCNCNDGACCEHYIPELTELEAQYLAYTIIKENREEEVLARLSSYDSSSGVCPLYNKEGQYHCSIYKGRGLVCRLFGAACFVDKSGRGVFHPCKWNKDRKELTGEKLSCVKAPIMGEYGRAIRSLEGNSQETEDINVVLPKAIGKIRLIMNLIGKDR